MAIYTPRGLKIRLPMDYAFALIARLYPRVDAWRVLKTTEGLEHIPSVLSLIVGIECVVTHIPPLHLGLAVFVASLIGSFITRRGMYLVSGLPGLGTAYSYFSGFGLILAAQVVGGFVFVGWHGVLAFYLGTWAASCCNWMFEFMQAKNIHRQSGLAVFGSEINFVNAYRLHASALGLDTNVDVSEEELCPESWWQAYQQFAEKYPEVVGRFSEYGQLPTEKVH